MIEQLVQCQGCHGRGGEKDVILEDGSGPWEPCGYCDSSGQTTRIMNAWIMRWANDPSFCPSKESEERHKRIMGCYKYLTAENGTVHIVLKRSPVRRRGLWRTVVAFFRRLLYTMGK